MSPARRLFVLAGFTLMIAGIVLLLSQEEEIFVALSVLGFVVVVAAVPRLSREPAEAGAVPATGVQPASEVEPATDAQPPTSNVTVVPSDPTLEHPPVADPEASGDGQEPQPEPSEPAVPAPTEPAAPDPSDGVEPAPAFPAPARWGTWRPPAVAADPQMATGPRRPSPRTAAVAGTALGAGALLWAWRRTRR